MKKYIVWIILLTWVISLATTYKVRAGTVEDTTEEYFEYEGATYKVINEKKHRVQLVKSRPLTEYDGKRYEQEAYVYNGDIKYSVYSIGYKAFSEEGLDIKFELKLPLTVRELKSESMGTNIKRLDMSETKVKTIPSFLFVTYEGIKNCTPAVAEVLLSQSCKNIQCYAFQKCKNLKSLAIPENVKKIGYHAFDKTCTEIKFDGQVPAGMVNQTMKNTVLYVKQEFYVDALELLIKNISLGRCEIIKSDY